MEFRDIIEFMGYHNIHFVGEGFFARVYRGNKKESIHAFKIKRKPGGLEHIVRESKVLKKLKGLDLVAQFVDYYDFERLNKLILPENAPFLVREFVEGETLFDKGENEEYKLKDKYKQALIDTIKEIHNMGYIPKDIHGANIIIDPDEVPHIIDFGMALSKKQINCKSTFEMLKGHNLRWFEKKVLSKY